MARPVEISKLAPFLRDFTEEHRAQPVTLEVLVGSTWNIEESGVPLIGLDVETKGRDAPKLEIILGDEESKDKPHLSHTVPRVTGVTVELNEKDEEERIVVASEDGDQAVLSID